MAAGGTKPRGLEAAEERLRRKAKKQEAELQETRKEIAAIWKLEEEQNRAAWAEGPGGPKQGAQGEDKK
eukprot:1690630-Heterocapsa_arctica.AAC.1